MQLTESFYFIENTCRIKNCIVLFKLSALSKRKYVAEQVWPHVNEFTLYLTYLLWRCNLLSPKLQMKHTDEN
jgi:hypothetical protein